MWNVIGHEKIIELLHTAIADNRLPHALLLTGPTGIGKTTLALELARTLNCIGDSPPCGACVHCHQIGLGSHPDVSVLEVLDGKDSIAIQQVRKLREEAAMRPYQGRRKVYVIAAAEALTPQAADALLKTLEEPQPYVMLVLTAAEPEALPTTIVSRCRVLTMRSVPADHIALRLEKDLPPDEARRVAGLARGNVGWALKAATQPKVLAQQEELLIRLAGVLDMDAGARLSLAETLTAEKKDRSQLRRSIELLLLLARDVLRLGQGLDAETATGDEQRVLKDQARRYGVDRSLAYIHAVKLAMERIDGNVDPRLALEALFMSVP